jgi:hypothetical protein
MNTYKIRLIAVLAFTALLACKVHAEGDGSDTPVPEDPPVCVGPVTPPPPPPQPPEGRGEDTTDSDR